MTDETKKYIGVLFLICFVAGLLVSLVYALTYSRIEERKRQELESALKEMFLDAKRIEETKKDDFIYYQAFDKEDKLLGYIFITEAEGYSSTIKAVVGILADGRIKEVKILEQNETPGIGSKIIETDFLNRFKGKSEGDKIDTITGATISSKSLIEAIKKDLKKLH